MNAVFASSGGQVIALETPTGIPAIISLKGLGSDTVLITGIGLGRDVHFQVQPALQDAIYLYSFGDRPGSLEIKGVLFWAPCKNDSDGLTDILKFYAQNKLSASGKPVSIALGKNGATLVKGYLHHVQIGAENAEMGMGTFSMSFIEAGT